jgi:hypothetical protein
MMDDKQFDRIADFVLDIKKEVDEVKQICMRNTVVLEEHARRSTASEGRLHLLEQKFEPIEMSSKVREHALAWAVGVLGALGTLFGIIDVIHNILGNSS